MIDKIKNNKLLMQIAKFIVVGGTATVIDFVLLFVLKEFVGLNEIVSNTISFTISLIYNYIASVKWVFDVDKNKKQEQQFLIFIIFSIIGLLINNLILWICIDKLKIHYLIGKVIATAIVMVFNFVTRKKFLE